METNYRILVMTSDNYLHAIRVFAHLINKYWQPNPYVVVSGFSRPNFDLPDNFTFFSAGKQEDFPWNKWSDALYITLEQCMTDDVFVLMLEDYWLTRMVNTQAVSLCADYARLHPSVLKMDLCADRLYAFGADVNYESYHYLDIVRSNPESAYHMSLYPGLWRGDNLLGMLVPNESPHDMELDGTRRLATMPGLEVFGTRQYPLKITLGLRARDHAKVNLEELSSQDVSYLKTNGYLKPWNL